MLELRNLSKNFGGVRAVDKLTATIEKGEIFPLQRRPPEATG